MTLGQFYFYARRVDFHCTTLGHLDRNSHNAPY